MTFCMCVSLYDGNKHCVNTRTVEIGNLTFDVQFCWTMPFFKLT